MTDLPGSRPWTGPTGQLVLNLKSAWGSRAMITPRLLINGQPVAVRWGRNEITVFPGALQIEISCSYLWEYGRAADTVPVSPHSRVEVYYAAPLFTLQSGRMGPVPQPQRGGPALASILIVLGLVVALVIVLAVLGS